jgi:hypothetical protein
MVRNGHSRLLVYLYSPAGTPVAVEGGYKNIEELQVGELVWAWHEQTGDLALKPLLHTMQRESDALVELQVGTEHPFGPTAPGPMQVT